MHASSFIQDDCYMIIITYNNRSPPWQIQSNMKSFQATLNQTIRIPTSKSETLEGWLTKCCQLLNNVRASVKIWQRVKIWWSRWLWDVLLCSALYLQQVIDFVYYHSVTIN